MKPIIGIDLGTTFSAIAVLDESGTSNIISVDGERIMASCISAPSEERGTLFVGNPARADLETEPENVVQHFKRYMGEDKTYQLKSGPSLSPADASSKVLKKLIQEAEKIVGKIDEVVITVPANFAERQRGATIEAGKKAGVKVKNIINEPTAAALTLATKQKVHGTVLIYDLGGGTFDVTIANIQGQNVECLTSEGHSHLGGVDFDNAICSLVDEAHTSEFGVSLKQSLGITSEEQERNSPKWQELLLECEKIKKALSKRSSSPLRYRSSPSGPLDISISRSDFETKIQDYISNTEMLVETALDNVDMSPSDIDIVLLVGGSTRIPAVKESLRQIFGKEPTESVNPDEAVAIGAAIYSGLRTDSSSLNPLQREKLENVAIQDVANHYYGTIANTFDSERQEEEASVSVIIERDTPLPCKKTETFYTASEGQRCIHCRVTQSATQERDPKFVNIIAEEDVGDFPANREAQQPIEITYSYDLDQTMHVSVKDVSTGKSYQLDRIHAENNATSSSPGLDLEDLVIE
jgi:molecular chaperone DnaK